jgi:hypothetical protein
MTDERDFSTILSFIICTIISLILLFFLGGCSSFKGNLYVQLPPGIESARAASYTVTINVQNKTIPVEVAREAQTTIPLAGM